MVTDLDASDLERLNTEFGRAGAVRFIQSELGGAVVELVTPQAVATVALHGAHVLSFEPRGAKPVLWMSPAAVIAEGKGIRGGIPVCWPWFAAHPTDVSKPDHGFVRKAGWRVAQTSADASRAGVELIFTDLDAFTHLWPYKCELTVRVTLTDVLQVDVTTVNLGDTAFTLTGALHTYFAISEISETSVHGLEQVTYLDKLQDFARETQDGAIAFPGEVDRIYEDTTGDVTIRDAGNGRIIRVAKQGSRSTVVWNPWVEKSARLGDMPPGTYRGMVCVETTNAGGDVVTLEPRAVHRLSAIISVEPLT